MLAGIGEIFQLYQLVREFKIPFGGEWLSVYGASITVFQTALYSLNVKFKINPFFILCKVIYAYIFIAYF